MKAIHGFTLEAIYDAAYLDQLGVTFDAFRRAPMATLMAVGQYDAIDILRAGFRPLLPAQVHQRRERDKQWFADDTPRHRCVHGRSIVAHFLRRCRAGNMGTFDHG